ncbi:CCNDBP1-like protein [Schizosaccharomyces osmophilus]|uniref:CCNDBP1-like protein n=1 Tax=Schizosaccharomyces osmophilus TaxID=2545709 RepID=A0AAE9WD79_9SCHI|nr:CCNDBP1-like protein [Schizosaccharomyces osmophilus]WBW73765.1 CCNDBP1-like protein [Schizosaccharomyces osmophilus]
MVDNGMDDGIVESLNKVLGIVVNARKAVGAIDKLDLPVELDNSPLSMLDSIGEMIHQYTTKLSIAARPPITKDALEKYSNDMSNMVSPLIATLQIYTVEKYGKIVYERLKMHVERILLGIECLLRSVSPKPLAHVTEAWKTRGRLVTTGMLWESCEKLQKLGREGALGYVLEEWENFVSMLEDAVSDMEDWKAGESSNWDSFGSEDEDEKEGQEEEENLTSEKRTQGQAEFAKQLLRQLNACKILFISIKKHRLPKTASFLYLDDLYEKMKHTSEAIDEVVGQVQEDFDNTKDELDLLASCGRELAQTCISEFDTDSSTPWYTKWLENWDQSWK